MKTIVTNQLASANTVQALTTAGADALATGYSTASLHSKRKADGIVFGAPAMDDEIRIRFSSAKTITALALHGHNFDVGVDCVVEGSTDNFVADTNWLGTFSPIALEAGRVPDVFFLPTPAAAYDDYRIRLEVLGGQTDPWQVGELVFAIAADIVTLSREFIWGYGVGRRMNNQLDVTPGGSPWSYHLSELGKTFALSWRGLTLTSVREIEAIFDATKGRHLPFTVVPFSAASDVEADKCFYVRFGSDVFEYTNAHTNDRMTSILLNEDPGAFDGTAA